MFKFSWFKSINNGTFPYNMMSHLITNSFRSIIFYVGQGMYFLINFASLKFFPIVSAWIYFLLNYSQAGQNFVLWCSLLSIGRDKWDLSHGRGQSLIHLHAHIRILRQTKATMYVFADWERELYLLPTQHFRFSRTLCPAEWKMRRVGGGFLIIPSAYLPVAGRVLHLVRPAFISKAQWLRDLNLIFLSKPEAILVPIFWKWNIVTANLEPF